ncbi:GH3 auxin-responsive promoter family protein [Blattabacterium cuenoti]|uniref:GH3 auxin-responsive promoter family protein n=1 Tax=Blattabacterium cuenoti TaxID=1653831 RepID=UPI00163CE022|nr:GH3 auxin-responsive promoter family protein [Blattabacterium cuenoti]
MNTFSGYLISFFIKKRIQDLELTLKYPIDIQHRLLKQLLFFSRNTEFGTKYKFHDIQKYQQFYNRIPLCKYRDIHPIIKRIRQGEKNILWPGKVKWFAKSSGTTHTKSKYIPVTYLAMKEGHYKAGQDMLSIYLHNHPKTKIFFGKALRLGGSHKLHKNYNTFYGDLSSILIKNLPLWAEYISIPKKNIALISEWEEKLKILIKETMNQDVRIMLGVCSWLLIFLNQLLNFTNKKTINEIWPNIEVIFHGGVNFDPYRKQYNDIFYQHTPPHYYNVYSASEGFFAVQDKKDSKDLLLLLNHGIFYEFISMDDFYHSSPKIIPLDEVELNKTYVLVISTNAGLWRYIVEDTIKFTNLTPYRIYISGRTNHFINSFGEELIMDNAEKALNQTCIKTDSIINEYTAGPIYINKQHTGAHEWIIEFKKPPKNVFNFRDILDQELKDLNSDYEIKRYKNLVLQPPIVYIARHGLFYDWLKMNKKLGGQNKIPRLSNNRKYLDDLLKIN